jgi:hypothetical protein
MAGLLSGVPVEQMMWTAIELRDEKVNWWAVFRTENEAAETLAAGLAVPTSTQR